MSKSVLITGSSAGIGKETARLFAKKGWNTIATMRNPEKEKELGDYENVALQKLDVTSKEGIDRVLQDSVEKYGQIDVLVNNAGIGVFGAFFSSIPVFLHN